MSSVLVPELWTPPARIAIPELRLPRRRAWWRTGHAPSDALVAAISVVGTPGCAAAPSLTLSAHAVDDLILMWAYRDGVATAPTVPSAGGTVPTWTTIETGGANSNAAVACYAKATATNHTSGSWTNATGVGCLVLRGQHATVPIGGHAQGGSAANGSSIPVVDFTPNVSDGTSFFVSVGGYRTVTSWGTPPAGYTLQANFATECFIATKDVTTSHGTWNMPTSQTGNGGYRTVQFEVIAAAGGGGGGGGGGGSSFFFGLRR